MATITFPPPPRTPLDPQQQSSVIVWTRWFEDISRVFQSLVIGTGASYMDKAGSGRRFRIAGMRIVAGTDESGTATEYLEPVWEEV